MKILGTGMIAHIVRDWISLFLLEKEIFLGVCDSTSTNSNSKPVLISHKKSHTPEIPDIRGEGLRLNF